MKLRSIWLSLFIAIASFTCTSNAVPVTLQYQFHLATSNSAFKVYQQIMNEFMAEHPDIKVELQGWATSSNHTENLRVRIAAGTAPDVTFLPNWDMIGFADNNLLTPLESYAERDKYDLNAYFPITIELCHYYKPGVGDHLYGLPSHPSPNAVYYNADAFAAAGLKTPPIHDPENTWTWDVLLYDAKRLTKDISGDGVIDQYGTSQPTSILYQLFPLIRSFGGGLVDDKVRRTVFNSDTITALQFVADLSLVHHVSPLPDVKKPSWPFANRFYAVDYDIYNNIITNQTRAGGAFDWNVALLPAGKVGRVNRSVAGMYVMLKTTKYPDAAWELIKYLTSDKAEYLLGVAGAFMPSRINTAVRLFNNPPESLRGINLSAFVEGLMGVGQKEATIPEWSEVQGLFEKEFAPVWTGKTPPQSALERIAQQVDALLATPK